MSKKILDRICDNPWCKAPFKLEVDEVEVDEITEDEMTDDASLASTINSLIKEIKNNTSSYEVVELPKKCEKCRNLDYEVTWEDKKYDGDRWDGKAHPVKFKFKEFRNGDWR